MKKPMWLVIFSGACLVALAAPARAQESSLFKRDVASDPRTGINLSNGSWYYRTLPPPKEVRRHDLITIRVTELAKTTSSGDMQRRKNASYDAVLKDWIKLVGLTAVKPAPQADGDPRVQGTLNQIYRADAELETSESLQFTITAEVADLRPNGNLVLEARRNIRVNNENWEYSLTGICRPEDIGPNNEVLSKNLAELNIFKRERGHVRDGYRRGWFTRWFDQFSPF